MHILVVMEKKMKRIIVGIDFSEPSLQALSIAVAMAGKNNAQLFVVYIEDNVLEMIQATSTTRDRAATYSSNILMAMINDIRVKSGIEATVIEATGHAAENLLRQASKKEADLIVLGNYGASGYRKGYIGSTSYRVVKYACCPVLLVPPGLPRTSFQQPLLPVRPVITALRHYEVFREIIDTGSSLAVLGLYPSGQDGSLYDLRELVEKMDAKFQRDTVTVQVATCNTANSIPQNVLVKANELGSDLIIVTPATDVSNKQFYIGPNTHYIMNNARAPLLIINRGVRTVMI